MVSPRWPSSNRSKRISRARCSSVRASELQRLGENVSNTCMACQSGKAPTGTNISKYLLCICIYIYILCMYIYIHYMVYKNDNKIANPTGPIARNTCVRPASSAARRSERRFWPCTASLFPNGQWTPRFSTDFTVWLLRIPYSKYMIWDCLRVILDQTYPVVFSLQYWWNDPMMDWTQILPCVVCLNINHGPQISSVKLFSEGAIEAPFGRFAIVIPLPCLTALVGCTLSLFGYLLSVYVYVIFVYCINSKHMCIFTYTYFAEDMYTVYIYTYYIYIICIRSPRHHIVAPLSGHSQVPPAHASALPAVSLHCAGQRPGHCDIWQ